MSEASYKMEGPGIVRAMQEAVSAKKDINFVYKRDNLGGILRVGYFLTDKGSKDLAQPDITWFDSSEIEVTLTDTPVGELSEPWLDVEFSHPRENERHFVLNLSLGSESRVILRNLFRVHKNHVTGFVIQVEIGGIIDGKEHQHAIVRYDRAHGFMHRDMIAYDGQKIKQELETQDTKDAIVVAIDEVRDNLNRWLQELGYSSIGVHALDQQRVIEEMEKAKTTLLELHDSPKKLRKTQSRYVHLGEYFDYNERI
jgi:hypothetical protein